MSEFLTFLFSRVTSFILFAPSEVNNLIQQVGFKSKVLTTLPFFWLVPSTVQHLLTS